MSEPTPMTPAEVTQAIAFSLLGVGLACAVYVAAWAILQVKTGRWKRRD